jgi:hypothetical protein
MLEASTIVDNGAIVPCFVCVCVLRASVEKVIVRTSLVSTYRFVKIRVKIIAFF